MPIIIYVYGKRQVSVMRLLLFAVDEKICFMERQGYIEHICQRRGGENFRKKLSTCFLGNRKIDGAFFMRNIL